MTGPNQAVAGPRPAAQHRNNPAQYALLVALGYDPVTHGVWVVKHPQPGIRVVDVSNEPVKFLSFKALEAMGNEPVKFLSFKALEAMGKGPGSDSYLRKWEAALKAAEAAT